VHDDLCVGSKDRCVARSRKTVFGRTGDIQQVGNAGFQSAGNAFDIVQPDIVFRAFDSTDIAAIQSAEFSENFL